jgi:transposase-like protein
MYGISSNVREIGIERKVVPCAFGIHQAGTGTALATKNCSPSQFTEVENTEVWQGILGDLKGRGLVGKDLKFIIIDGNLGLPRTLKTSILLSNGSAASLIKCATWQ